MEQVPREKVLAPEEDRVEVVVEVAWGEAASVPEGTAYAPSAERLSPIS